MGKFILGLNTAKKTNYIAKCFKQNFCRLKFPKKKPYWTHISIYLRSGARAQRFAFLKYYNAPK